ncbi:MAG: hypothetical protein U0703_12350 [Anaerolineae bacterium]
MTVGAQASEQFDKLQSADNYSEAYFFPGLAVQAAEATASFRPADSSCRWRS